MKHLSFFLALALLSFSCNKKESDLCDDCGPNGTCIDGVCQCNGLWSGENCDQQTTPLLITVRGITLLNMPATDANGAGWDITSGADVFILVIQNGVTILDTSNDWRQNAPIGTAWNNTFSITDPYSPITVQLWDFDDFDANDLMGSITGTLYNNTNGYPLSVTTSAGNISVRFGPLEYL